MSAASEFVYTIKAEYAGATDLQKLSADLKDIGNIKSFEKLSADIEKTEQKLDAAEKKAALLKQTSDQSGTKSDASAYARAAAEVDRTTIALEKQNAKLEQNAASLKAAGISVTELAAAQASLGSSASGKGMSMAAESLLGVRSFSDIKAEIKSLESAYASLVTSGTRSDAELAKAHEALLLKTQALNAEMKTAPGVLAQAGTSMKGAFLEMGAVIAGVFAVERLVEFGKRMVEIADEEMLVTARLRMISASEEELHHTEEALYASSQKTGTSFASNADILARMGIILNDTGIKNAALIPIIDTLNKTLVVSGASAEKSASFMNAFVYAMDSGGIAARQLRTMLKDDPELFKLLAQQLGTTVAGLKELADKGELTTNRVMVAIQKMSGQVDKDFAAMPVTINRASTELSNAWNKIVNDANQSSGGIGSVTGGIKELTKELEDNKPAISNFIASMATMAAATVGASSKAYSASVAGFGELLKLTEDFGLKIRKSASGMTGEDPAELQRQIEFNKRYWETIAGAAKAGGQKIKDANHDAAADLPKAFAPVTDNIKKQFQDMADKIKGIYDQIGHNNFDLSKSIADIQRSGMNEGDAWTSLRAEADKYAKSAQAAAAAGDWKTANAEMAAAISDAKALSNEVTVNGEKMSARNAKIDEMNKLNKIANGILEDQAAAEKKDATKLNDSTGGELAKKMPEVAAALGIVKDKVAEINQEFKLVSDATNTWTNVFKTSAVDIDASNKSMATLVTTYSELQKMAASALIITNGDPAAAVKLVKQEYQSLVDQMKNQPLAIVDTSSVEKNIEEIKRVESEQEKLSAEAAKYSVAWDASWSSFLQRGLDNIASLDQKLNDMARDRTMTIHVNQDGGSSADGYATGGDPFHGGLSGYGGGDRRLILVEDGEHVIRKEAVAKWGHGFFQKFNRLNFPPTSKLSIDLPASITGAFADGGAIGPFSSGDSHTHFHFAGDVSPISQANAKQNAKMIMSELERMKRRSS